MLKLYDATVAPNPRRVRMFAAEKAIPLELIPVDLAAGQNRRPEFLAKNPTGHVPVLELEDGSCLSESLVICEYLEEIRPDPVLIGETPLERAHNRMWERRMEFEIARHILGAFVHSSPFFEGRLTQVPAYADACRETAAVQLRWIDRELSGRPFVEGGAFTIADITLFCALDFGHRVGEGYDAQALPALARWHAKINARPSAAA
jgi:glutathione S-transferase